MYRLAHVVTMPTLRQEKRQEEESNNTAIAASVPSHPASYFSNDLLEDMSVHVIATMQEEDYTLLCEILDRAHSILHSSPTPNSSLSFLRILTAYDQIFLRHDRATEIDTTVYQWLLTLNIRVSEMRNAGDDPMKQTYEMWRGKLEELYEESQSNAAAAQEEMQRQELLEQQHQHQQTGSSIPRSPYTSSLASYPPTQPRHTSHAAASAQVHPLHDSLPASAASRYPLSPSDSRSRDPSLSPNGKRRQLFQGDIDDAEEEREFMHELQEGPHRRDLSSRQNQLRHGDIRIDAAAASPATSSFSPTVRDTMIQCFTSWRTYCRPRFSLQQRVLTREANDTRALAHHCYHSWRQLLQVMRYSRYLASIEHRMELGLQRNILMYWHGLVHKLQQFRERKRDVYLASLFQRWRNAHREVVHTRQLQTLGVLVHRRQARLQAVRTWTRYTRRQRRIRLECHHVDGFYQSKLLPMMWNEWRELFVRCMQQKAFAREQLNLLRKQLYVRKWRSHAMTTKASSSSALSTSTLLHRHRSTPLLTVSQFHILFRWLHQSHGNGYDLFRIVKLGKMKYADSNNSNMNRNVNERRAHPFIVNSAATAASSYYSSNLNEQFAALGNPSSSSSFASSNVSTTALSTSASPLPHRHTILSLLNTSLTFRHPKLPSLLLMIDSWMKWYQQRVFVEWRKRCRLRKERRIEEERREMERRRREEEVVHAIVQARELRTLSQVWTVWRAAHRHTLTLTSTCATFLQQRTRRQLSHLYSTWKYTYVAMHAWKIFRVREALAQWKEYRKRNRNTQYKCEIIQATAQRSLLVQAYRQWRYVFTKNLTTKRSVTQIVWMRWRAKLAQQREQAQELRDADLYYKLKLLMKNLLVWRALSYTQMSERKYETKAKQQYEKMLLKRHTQHWIQRNRRIHETQAMQLHGSRIYSTKLLSSAVSLWQENIHARIHRHTLYRLCRVQVRNKHLAWVVLNTWWYHMKLREKEKLLQKHSQLQLQHSAYSRWKTRFSQRRTHFDTLEYRVSSQHDASRVKQAFCFWLQSTHERVKAKLELMEMEATSTNNANATSTTTTAATTDTTIPASTESESKEKEEESKEETKYQVIIKDAADELS